VAKAKKIFVCRDCGTRSAGWAGRCSGCDSWASIEEATITAGGTISSLTSSADGTSSRPLAEFIGDAGVPSPTGLDEVDRVLGGGLIAGSVILLGGEPGIGKSTLTLQIAIAVASHGASVLLVAGEEAPTQIATRARRLGSVPPSVHVLDDISVEATIAAMEDLKPQVVVVDSIQTIEATDLDGNAGSVAQMKAVTERLSRSAKRLGITLILVGHITKDGSLAGPKTIEHLVDTVCTFSGERSGDLRQLRLIKNRYGPTTEVGLFEMTAAGLAGVSDPSGRFLADRRVGLPGSSVVCTFDSGRPLLAEVQALLVETAAPSPKTTTQGVDGKRLAIVAAVLTQRVGLATTRYDIFVSAAGGAKLSEPGADLGLAIAMVSSMLSCGLPPELIAIGEVGLGGEVRSVPRIDLRLQEAHRLGFRLALVPATVTEGPVGMKLQPVATVGDAVRVVTDLSKSEDMHLD